MSREELFIELQTAWDVTAKQSKEDLFTALFSIGTGDQHTVMDWMNTNGIPLILGEKSAQGLWYQYQAEATKRQHEADEKRRRIQAQQTLSEAAQKAAEAAGETLQPSDYRKAVDDITKSLEALRDDLTEGTKHEPLTPDNLIEFGNTNGYPVDFLGGFTIPSPGITIIGGKAASGKTTALINAVRSLLKSSASVAFFSYEQTKQDIALALALSITAQNGSTPIDTEMYGPRERVTLPPDTEMIRADQDAITNDYHNSLKRHIQKNGIPEWLKTAYNEIKGHIAAGKLELWDYYGDAAQLAKRIERTNHNVYVIDYVQVIPPAPGDAREGYQKMSDVTKYLRSLGSAAGKTLIIGAQFNRQAGENGSPGMFDPSMEQFREAADIEHLASLAIGLGSYKTESGDIAHYWKILKHRYNGAARDARMYSGGHFQYYYAQQYSKWIPGNETWPPAWGPKQHNGNSTKAMKQNRKTNSRTVAEKAAANSAVSSGDII